MTAIKGFGPANASALLASYFPEALPVIDRLVLLGAGIEHHRNKQKQVINIERHYGSLIRECYKALKRRSQTSLRELDKSWFQEGQRRSKQLRREAKNTDV